MTRFFLDNFDPRALFSWPVFTVSLVWSVATNFTDVDNNPPGNEGLRAASVIAAHLVLFGAAGVYTLVVRRLPPLVGAVSMVPAVVALSLLRGYVVFSLLFAIGHDGPDLLSYRLMGSVTNVGMSILVTAVVVHRVRTYRNTRRALLSEQIRLIEVRDHARDRLGDITKRTLEDVRAALVAALELDRHRPVSATADRIEHTIDDIVRPLSYQLERESFAWTPTPIDSHAETLDWRQVLRGALSPHHVYPLSVGLAMTAVALSTTVRNQNLLEGVYILLCALVGSWAGLSLLRALVASLRALWARRVAMVTGAGVTGLFSGLLTLPVKLETERPFSLVVQAPLFVLAFTILFAIAGSATRQAALATGRLRETTAELTWEVARLSEEYRHARRSLARALHGKVQAGMMSSLMRLRQALREDAADVDAVAAHAQTDLAALVDSLGLDDAREMISLDDAISDIQQTWEGLASCEWEIDSHTRAMVEGDPVAAGALVDIVPELAFNSIKHGQATRVGFTLALDNERTIRLTCSDNGSQPADAGRVGLGTQLLDECALRWDRQSSRTGTVTTVLLPFASPKAPIEAHP